MFCCAPPLDSRSERLEQDVNSKLYKYIYYQITTSTVIVSVVALLHSSSRFARIQYSSGQAFIILGGRPDFPPHEVPCIANFICHHCNTTRPKVIRGLYRNFCVTGTWSWQYQIPPQALCHCKPTASRMLLPANPTPPKVKKSKKNTVQANGLVVTSTLQIELGTVRISNPRGLTRRSRDVLLL